MSSRDEILAAVRAAAPPRPEPVPRAYRRVGALGPGERVARFCERAADYRATVLRLVAEAEVPAAVAEICARRGARRLGIPPRLPAAWRPKGIELVEDRGLSPQELDALDGALTGCAVAVAETGTLVLAAGAAEGRRALTLVPDLHLCVVREEQVVELLPEALALVHDLVALERRPLTFVSGPSATSDIELSRVEGVHGPRTLVVLVVKESQR